MASKKLICLVAVALLLNVVASQGPPTRYNNHTVGDAAGWFFNETTNKTSADYTAWAATQAFNLGDFLIFNTDTNQTVIQTYNETTYKSCSVDDSLDTDTFQYLGGSDKLGQALTIAVPLTIKGKQYFFSTADDGIQCQNGMAFAITVAQGLGLPPSLNQPPPPPYVEPPSSPEGGDPTFSVATSPPNSGVKTGTSTCLMLPLFVRLVLYLV